MNTPSEFQLRAPTSDDLANLSKLGRETFVESFGSLYSETDLNHFLESVYPEDVVARELANADLSHQVIDAGDDLVAFIKIGPVHVPAENPKDNDMEIWQIYVRRNFISRGLGTRLIQWACEEFERRQVGDIYVSVFSENKRAIRFYQHHGFEKVGEYGFPVGEQIDLEWIMRRPGSGA